MKKLFTLFIFFNTFCIQSFAFSPVPDWVERPVDITAWGSSQLYLQGSIIARVVNEAGDATDTGLFLKIMNFGDYPCYYKARNISTYQSKNDPNIFLTVTNVATWYDVPAGKTVVIPVGDGSYFSKEDRKKNVTVLLYFKYSRSKTTKKAGVAAWTALQNSVNAMPKAPKKTPGTTPANNNAKRAQQYYFMVAKIPLQVKYETVYYSVFSEAMELKERKATYAQEEYDFLKKVSDAYPQFQKFLERYVRKELDDLPVSTSIGQPVAGLSQYNTIADCKKGMQEYIKQVISIYDNLQKKHEEIFTDIKL